MMIKDDLRKICGQISSPAYVFSSSEFKERASATKRLLGDDIGICYSIKANPYLLCMLPDEFSAVEVCSPGELNICINLGVAPDKIIYSGLNKGDEDIARAVDYGAGILTAESRLHLEMIEKCAAARGITVSVLARASAGSQFGIDRHELPGILAEHDKYPHINFAGLHFFTGTQKRKAKEIIKETEFLERYIEELRDASGLALPRIEYGTGLPVYMFEDSEISSSEDAYDAELAMLEEIAQPLRELSRHAELTIEMGRFFAASCGHYFSEIIDSKTNDGVNYLIIDGGSHQIRYFGQMQGMQVPLMDLIKCGEPARLDNIEANRDTGDGKWTIAGSLCTTADVLARGACFDGQRPDIGDVIAFHQAGAYALYECMSLFLSRDMPSIYLMTEGSQPMLVRSRKETSLFNLPEDIDSWL